MKIFKTLTNALLLAVGLLSGGGLSARAQTITLNGTAAAATAAQVGGGGLQYACTPYSLASPTTNEQTFVFTPGVNNEVIDKWTLQGDATASTGITGTTFKFFPTGFGKARVTVGYYYTTGYAPVQCPDSFNPVLCNGEPLTTPVRAYTTRTYEFFKLFTPAQGGYGITGPTCLPTVNATVVYSVNPPVVTTPAQAAANIGTDTYTWVVTYTSGPVGVINTPVTFTTTTDGTTITIQNANFRKGNFNVEVKAGKCNSAPGTAGFSIPVVITPDLNDAITAFPPACLPIGSTGNSTFSLATVLGATYSLGTTVGLMSTPSVTTPATNISFAGTGSSVTVTLSGITATNSGAITIVGVGGTGVCFGTQTVIKQVTRQLVAPTNAITPPCVAAGSTTTFTLSLPPTGGQAINWTVAGSGWSILSGNGTASISVLAGTGPATLTAQANGCNVGSTGIISKSVAISAPVAGCALLFVNAGGANPTCSFTASVPAAPTPCPLNNANRYNVWRLYDLGRALPASNQLVETKTPADPTLSTTGFAYQTDLLGTARVEVDVTNTAPGGMCLKDTYGKSNLTFIHCPVRGTAALGAATGSRQALKELVAFPNPTGNTLQIDLALKTGTAKLTLLDALGRVQHSSSTATPHTTLDLSHLAEGVYTLRAELPTGHVLTEKVEVRR